MTHNTKLSNPKDHFGSRKVDISLVPFTLIVAAARALLEGALKYGRFNWRICGVRSSIYHSAFQRHVAKWWNGQNHDKKTRVHHLDNAIACLAIIRDAELYGKLNDDRPPCPNPDAMADLIDSCEGDVAFLKELFKDEQPYQYTIADTAGVKDDTRGTSEGPGEEASEEVLPASLLPHASAERDGEAVPGFQWLCEWEALRYRDEGAGAETHAQAAAHDFRLGTSRVTSVRD